MCVKPWTTAQVLLGNGRTFKKQSLWEKSGQRGVGVLKRDNSIPAFSAPPSLPSPHEVRRFPSTHTSLTFSFLLLTVLLSCLPGFPPRASTEPICFPMSYFRTVMTSAGKLWKSSPGMFPFQYLWVLWLRSYDHLDALYSPDVLGFLGLLDCSSRICCLS